MLIVEFIKVYLVMKVFRDFINMYRIINKNYY